MSPPFPTFLSIQNTKRDSSRPGGLVKTGVGRFRKSKIGPERRRLFLGLHQFGFGCEGDLLEIFQGLDISKRKSCSVQFFRIKEVLVFQLFDQRSKQTTLPGFDLLTRSTFQGLVKIGHSKFVERIKLKLDPFLFEKINVFDENPLINL